MSELPTKARDMYCAAIYGAAHVINRAYTPMLKPMGLTYPQYLTLTLLWETDGQTVGALAGQLHMESSTLTPLLKRLEAKELVKRQRSTTDERLVNVTLTKEGKALRKEARKITECMIAGSGMDMETLTELVNTLHQLTDNIIAND